MEIEQNIQNINPNIGNIYSQPLQDTQKNKVKLNKIVPVILIIFFLCAISVGAYYLGSKKFFQKSITNDKQSTIISTPTPEEIPLFTGKLQKLNQDLKIFSNSGGHEDKASYYSAGIFNKGDLKGYTRIIITKPNGPYPYTFTLATKDFQTYILNDSDQNTTNYSEKDWQNLYLYLDKNKISAIKTFDTYQPKSIKLNDNLSLYYNAILGNSHETTDKDSLGNTLYEYLINIDFSTFKSLNSPDKNLTFYYQPISRPQYFDQLDQASKDSQIIKEKFINTTSEITVIDPTGLPIIYILAFNKNVDNYQPKSDSASLSTPHLSFIKSDIVNAGDYSFYTKYNKAIPGGCAFTNETFVTNFIDNDFDKVGTVFTVPVYRLKDKNHSLYKLAYDNKMEYYNRDSAAWDQVNKGLTKPTLTEYVDNNPLLFIKDYWQRWVALGEYDIQLPGGCGKPVIYLYPEKPTEVSVKFNSPVQFTTDIPKYNDFWQVLAQPNGSLKNLKTNDCSQIDSSKKGSEYAANACKSNNYPYLYWAGNIYSREYPYINEGWIIENNNIGKFLENKLSEIGLNIQEKEDFINYWLPDMKSKNAPFYRISFLQTQDLNRIFPMTISPIPNTIFRIFLDYLPLNQKPDSFIKPQVLNKLIRQGFTMVEWGGLKRY